MAALRRKGKFLFVLIVCLLFSDSFYSPRFSCLNVLASDIDPSSNSNSVKETDSRNGNNLKEKSLDKESENPDVVLLKKQQFQLEKLEELVKNLTQLVDKLESRFTEAPEKEKTVPSSSSHDETRDAERKKEEPMTPSEEGEEQEQGKGVKGGAGRGRGGAGVSEKVQYILVGEGFSKYFAVGDDTGKLYVFLRSGDVALEFDTFLESEGWSPITAMVSYLSVYKNESMIITGHENGDILMLRVWETLTGDEWSSLHVERVGKFDMPESGGSQINILEVHHVGRKRYILATDAGGKIFVFRENGTVYGTATPSRPPIAFLKQRLLFLTETGAGSLDLRTMKLKESECEGFNSSSAKNYVFDATDRSKAYGFTIQGELIQTLLLGDIMNFKCRVRSKRKLDVDNPMALHAIKGYLLIANREKVVVYNVSSQHYVRSGGVRLVFSAGLDEIIASFLHQQASDVEDEKRMQTPLIASDYEKLVIVSLGNGYVAMYRSKLPVFKNEFNSILWTSPVLFFILFLFGAWHFFANKKEVLTSWGPDDPFSSASVTGGAPLGSGSGDRSFTDTSRTSDIMDLRGSGLRGPSRYVSPPRFPGGTANSYRPGPDTDSRPAPVDPRFRATSELKFRGSNVESAGIPKRRESLFGNSQVVDDSN
ncbi:putative membrane protein [Sesamum angolense]|uniref:Membrane protein n=1 Tax=Sesamum angolense TaxID=2727404 RepID=A0AAE1WJW2_9LAMI|nr:putative membrane protein [Sesamum angolense]